MSKLETTTGHEAAEIQGAEYGHEAGDQGLGGGGEADHLPHPAPHLRQAVVPDMDLDTGHTVPIVHAAVLYLKHKHYKI